jgi:hypothetical protein
MSDPTRLLASPDATDLEKQLLDSWTDERPSADARDKTLAMLGLAGGATAMGAASASIAPKAAAAGWAALAKWIAVSVIGLGGAIAAVTVATRAHHADEIAPVETNAPTVVAKTPAPVETTQATPVAPAPIELRETETHHATAQAKVAPPAASTLAQQVAALDRARAALDSGDTARARRLADAYEAEYPGGAFTQEAEVVRIDALVRENNRAEAERAAKRFLAAYPKSPHAARVRTLLGYDP